MTALNTYKIVYKKYWSLVVLDLFLGILLFCISFGLLVLATYLTDNIILSWFLSSVLFGVLNSLPFIKINSEIAEIVCSSTHKDVESTFIWHQFFTIFVNFLLDFGLLVLLSFLIAGNYFRLFS